MFVLPLLALPFIFLLAAYRLYQIPMRLRAGRLRVPERRRALWSVASTVAYLVLSGYTVALGAALAQAAFFAADRLPAYLALTGYVLAYPLVYMAAAWVFFHGLKPLAEDGTEP